MASAPPSCRRLRPVLSAAYPRTAGGEGGGDDATRDLDHGRAHHAEGQRTQVDEAAGGGGDVARANRGDGGRVVQHIGGGGAEAVARRGRMRKGRTGGSVGGEVLRSARAAIGLEGTHLDLEAVEVLGGRDPHAHAQGEHGAALRELEASGGTKVDVVHLGVEVGLDATLCPDVGAAADRRTQLDRLVVVVEEREGAAAAHSDDVVTRRREADELRPVEPADVGRAASGHVREDDAVVEGERGRGGARAPSLLDQCLLGLQRDAPRQARREGEHLIEDEQRAACARGAARHRRAHGGHAHALRLEARPRRLGHRLLVGGEVAAGGDVVRGGVGEGARDLGRGLVVGAGHALDDAEVSEAHAGGEGGGQLAARGVAVEGEVEAGEEDERHGGGGGEAVGAHGDGDEAAGGGAALHHQQVGVGDLGARGLVDGVGRAAIGGDIGEGAARLVADRGGEARGGGEGEGRPRGVVARRGEARGADGEGERGGRGHVEEERHVATRHGQSTHAPRRACTGAGALEARPVGHLGPPVGIGIGHGQRLVGTRGARCGDDDVAVAPLDLREEEAIVPLLRQHLRRRHRRAEARTHPPGRGRLRIPCHRSDHATAQRRGPHRGICHGHGDARARPRWEVDLDLARLQPLQRGVADEGSGALVGGGEGEQRRGVEAADTRRDLGALVALRRVTVDRAAALTREGEALEQGILHPQHDALLARHPHDEVSLGTELQLAVAGGDHGGGTGDGGGTELDRATVEHEHRGGRTSGAGQAIDTHGGGGDIVTIAHHGGGDLVPLRAAGEGREVGERTCTEQGEEACVGDGLDLHLPTGGAAARVAAVKHHTRHRARPAAEVGVAPGIDEERRLYREQRVALRLPAAVGVARDGPRARLKAEAGRGEAQRRAARGRVGDAVGPTHRSEAEVGGLVAGCEVGPQRGALRTARDVVEQRVVVVEVDGPRVQGVGQRVSIDVDVNVIARVDGRGGEAGEDSRVDEDAPQAAVPCRLRDDGELPRRDHALHAIEQQRDGDGRRAARDEPGVVQAEQRAGSQHEGITRQLGRITRDLG
eukprot:scaffold65784_cov60-Phaeocystis_antarctica.AAC.2